MIMESNYSIVSLQESPFSTITFDRFAKPFPLLRDRIENPHILFDNLKKYTPKIIQKPIQYKYILWKTKMYQIIKYKNQNYISIETHKNDYIDIDRLVDYFNELPRMKARRRDKPYSAFEAWNKKFQPGDPEPRWEGVL